MYLLTADLAGIEPNKQKRRKWSDMNESTACLQGTSISMRMSERELKFMLLKTMHPERFYLEVSSLKSILITVC